MADFDPNEGYSYAASAENDDDSDTVVIKCLERKKCINGINYFDDGGKESFSIDTYYMETEIGVGHRVAKAFSHLIKLCGGKTELF